MEENYLMSYDALTGEIKGFYLNDAPMPYIEITAEKHKFYTDNQGKYKLNPQTLEDELIPIVNEPPDDKLLAVESAISVLITQGYITQEQGNEILNTPQI